MKRFKTFFAVALMVLMLFSLTGCGMVVTLYPMDEDIMIMDAGVLYTEEEFMGLMGMDTSTNDENSKVLEHFDILGYVAEEYKDDPAFLGILTINDVKYLGMVSGKGRVMDVTTDGVSRCSSKGVYLLVENDNEKLTQQGLGEYASLSDEQLKEILKTTPMIYIVNFDDEVIFTNGKLSEDKKTVTFNVCDYYGTEENVMYAYTKGYEDIVFFDNVTNGYTNDKKVVIDTPDKIKKVVVNGTEYKKDKEVKLEDDGKYVIEVTTKYSKKTVEVVKDSVKPKVTGVKNKKSYTGGVTIKYSDAGSGVALATVDGVKIKNKARYTEVGEHTLVVADKAGNKTTIKFTIKE